MNLNRSRSTAGTIRAQHPLWRQPRNFENAESVARWKEYCWGFPRDFVCLTSLKKRCFCTQEVTLFLSTCVITASRRVLSNKLMSVLGRCWLDSLHITSLKKTLCFFRVVCSPPTRSRQVTRMMWHRSASLKQFRFESTDSSRRERFQSSHLYHVFTVHMKCPTDKMYNV